MKLLLAFLVFTSALALAPFNRCAYDKADDNVYLFMFHEKDAPDCSSIESLQKFFDIRAHGAKVTRAWSFINGGAIDLSYDVEYGLAAMRSIPEILVVEENCLARIPRGEEPSNSSLLQNDPQRWNLYRQDQCTQTYSTSLPFNPPNFGAGVNAWILDTGILPTHQEFTGRATNYWSGYPGPNAGVDRNGHGTHCAGTVGGANVGFARSARLYSNQVLNAQGSGSYDIVVEGVNQAVAGAKTTAGPDVISMSLGGPVSDTLDAAINAASNGNSGGQKIPVIVAAGNDAASAIGYSPCRAQQAICVGATTSTDTLSSFSNYGSKVNTLAPGSSIYSAYYTSNSAYATMSGTSMACPAVAGGAAIYGAMNNANLTPDGVRSGLSSFGTKNAINRGSSLPTGTPNILCYDHWKTC